MCKVQGLKPSLLLLVTARLRPITRKPARAGDPGLTWLPQPSEAKANSLATFKRRHKMPAPPRLNSGNSGANTPLHRANRKKTEAMEHLRLEVKELEKDANAELQLANREGRG